MCIPINTARRHGSPRAPHRHRRAWQLDRCREVCVLLALVVAACDGPRNDAPRTRSTVSPDVEGGPSSPDPRRSATHPLDPLSLSEIDSTSSILRSAGYLSGRRHVVSVSLSEPPKSAVARHSGRLGGRTSHAVVIDHATSATFEAVVDLTVGRVVAWHSIPAAHAALIAEDGAVAVRAVDQDERWMEALRRRRLVPGDVDPSVQPFGAAAPDGHRRVRLIPFKRDGRGSKYSRPIDGLVAVVNVATQRVESVVDVGRADVPEGTALAPDAAPQPGSGPSPLHVSQRGGSSVSYAGRQVRWAGWRFRVSIHPREGLVLHQAEFGPGDRPHSVLYRGSLSEMLVPYASPDSAWFFRAGFDVGEFMLGGTVRTLVIGADAPEHASFIDAAVARDGSSRFVERAIAVYERDAGVLWSHRDQVVRARQLVVRSVFSVGNYDYGVSWLFHEDGTLAAEVEATGIMFVKAAPATSRSAARAADDGHAHRLNDGLSAVHHQHFYSFRLDLDVVTTRNSLLEVNAMPEPAGPTNPHGNAFRVHQQVLASERAAARDVSVPSSRVWRVTESGRRAAGESRGYTIHLNDAAFAYLGEGSPILARAGFVRHQLWATQYSGDEDYAAGDYPNQHAGGDGLPRWISDDASLVNADLVVWLTVGTTHIPRPEDWPVVRTTRAGFTLRPYGFR